MKQDIEWLKKEIRNLPSKSGVFKGDGCYHIDFYVPVKAVDDLIDKFEKSEVLSQELSVIPKFVVDWIIRHRGTYDLYPALRMLENNTLVWSPIYEWYRMNTHKFVKAYLTGEYEVEEEQKYFALIKGHELVNDEDDWACNYWNLSTSDGRVFPGDRFSTYGYLTKMSKEDWNVYGINDSNADLIKVKEVEE